jgi:YVTN family beta-propeller protein
MHYSARTPTNVLRHRRLIMAVWVFCLGLGLGLGCQPKKPTCQAVAPLKELGEVYLYAEAFSLSARQLDVDFDAIRVEKADGTSFNLTTSKIVGKSMARPRLLAWGRIPPGDYTGVLIKAKRAQIAGSDGPSDLLLTEAVSKRAISFSLRRRQAVVLYLKADLGKLLKGVKFTPLFDIRVESKGSTDIYGYVANSGSQTLTIFDSRTRRVVRVIPTGRTPRGLAIDRNSGRLYLALSGEDEVEVIDTAAGESVKRIRLRPGDRPEEVALSSDGGTLITVNRGSNTASFVDVRSGLEVKRTPTGEEPTGILVDRNGQRAYIFNRRSNDITVLDITNQATVATVSSEVEPLRGQVNREGTRLFVAHRASAYLLAYSLPDLAVVERVFVGLGMSSIKVDPNTDLVYVGMEGGEVVRVYDAASLVPVETVDVVAPVDEMTIGAEDNTMLFLARDKQSITFMDLTNRKIVGELKVGCSPYAVGLMKERR